MEFKIVQLFCKDCDCKNATASTSNYRINKLGTKITLTHTPGPSCNICGEAWKDNTEVLKGRQIT